MEDLNSFPDVIVFDDGVIAYLQAICPDQCQGWYVCRRGTGIGLGSINNETANRLRFSPNAESFPGTLAEGIFDRKSPAESGKGAKAEKKAKE
jgi:hypothetical protein